MIAFRCWCRKYHSVVFGTQQIICECKCHERRTCREILAAFGLRANGCYLNDGFIVDEAFVTDDDS